MLNSALIVLIIKHLGQYYLSNEKFMKSSWANQISVSVWLAAMFALTAILHPVVLEPVRTHDFAGMALCTVAVGIEYLLLGWFRSVRKSTIYVIRLTEKKGLHRSLLMCRSFMVMYHVYVVLLLFGYIFISSNAEKFLYP